LIVYVYKTISTLMAPAIAENKEIWKIELVKRSGDSEEWDAHVYIQSDTVQQHPRNLDHLRFCKVCTDEVMKKMLITMFPWMTRGKNPPEGNKYIHICTIVYTYNIPRKFCSRRRHCLLCRGNSQFLISAICMYSLYYAMLDRCKSHRTLDLYYSFFQEAIVFMICIYVPVYCVDSKSLWFSILNESRVILREN